MAQQQFNAEAPLSFLAALVRTIVQIEDAQPEPGFRDVFMSLLDKNLEGAIAGDAANGMDTRESVQIIRKALGGLLVSKDLADALSDATE